jgi:hypothetical protein
MDLQDGSERQLESYWESFRYSTESVYAWSTVQTLFPVFRRSMHTLSEIATGIPVVRYVVQHPNT